MTKDVHSDTYPAIDPTKANFKGKSVFISGASRGLGRAMCVSFAKAGASIIALGARGDTSETAKAILDAAAAAGKPAPKILPIKFDVSDKDSVDAAAAKVRQEFGKVDIVIANAAILETGKMTEMDPDAWVRTFTTNTVGLYLLYRSFIPLMLEGGNKTIITVSSVGAHLVGPGYSAYQTSKFTVLRLAEFACAEYGDQGLLAYSIHPGNIPTDIVGGMEGLQPELRHGELFCRPFSGEHAKVESSNSCCSICRYTRAQRRLSRISDLRKKGLARGSICQLVLGFASADGEKGRNRVRG